MLVDPRCPIFGLIHDPARTPAKDKELDPLWDDMAEQGVPMAPEVFFRGEYTDRLAAAFLKLPVDFVQRRVVDRQNLDIHYLTLQPKSLSLSFHRVPRICRI